MKKLLMAAAAVALTAVTAVSLSACATSQRVKMLDVRLAGERYGYCVAQTNTDLMGQVNSLIESLVGSEPYNPEDANSGTDAVGVQYDLNGDGTAETVTFKTLYEAVNSDTEYPVDAYNYETLPSNVDIDNCLVVATNAEFEPFEYMIGDSFAGIDMHIAKMLANALDEELVIKNMDFEVVITDVETGASDIGMAGLTINHGREQIVSFSDAYYQTTQRVAVLESDTTFDNCKTEEEFVAAVNGLGKITAGAATGQTGYFYIAGSTDFDYAGFPDVDVQDYESIGLAVTNLSNGRLRFVVGDMDTLRSAVEETNGRIPAEEE